MQKVVNRQRDKCFKRLGVHRCCSYFAESRQTLSPLFTCTAKYIRIKIIYNTRHYSVANECRDYTYVCCVMQVKLLLPVSCTTQWKLANRVNVDGAPGRRGGCIGWEFICCIFPPRTTQLLYAYGFTDTASRNEPSLAEPISSAVRLSRGQPGSPPDSAGAGKFFRTKNEHHRDSSCCNSHSPNHPEYISARNQPFMVEEILTKTNSTSE